MQNLKINESLINNDQKDSANSHLMEAEGECKISSIQALRVKLIKAIPLIFLSIITVVPLILLLNFKRVRKYIVYSACDFDEADHLFVETEQGTFDLVALNNENGLKTFIFQQLKYKLQGNNYVPMVLDYNKYLNMLQIKQFIKYGLTLQQFKKYKHIYGSNQHQVQIQNYFSYMLSVIFQPLYILQYIVVLSLTAQGLPLFGIILVLASWITTSGNYIALYLGKKKIRQMAVKSQIYTVIRNGIQTKTGSQDLVPGDLICLVKGPKLPCDCVLVQGEIFVDESSLTGQNIPIKKSIYQKNNLNKQNWLSDGTKILQTKDALAIVIFTGFASKKGRLLRKILYRVASQPDFFMKMFYFLLESFLIAIALYGATLSIRLNANISKYIVALRVLDYLISSVPPAFPVYFTVAYSWSLYRLKKRQIYSTMPEKTVEGNRLKSACFDKTGTLTTNDIRLKDICLATKQGIRNIQFNNNTENNIGTIKILFGTCHSVRKIDGKDMGDQVDLKMFQASSFKFAPNTNSLMSFEDENQNQFEILCLNQFQSRFQSMSVLVKQIKTNKHYIFAKGAPQKIHNCSAKKITNYDQIIGDMSFKGLRTIAFGWKSVTLGQISHYVNQDRQQFLKNIQILGIVTFNNALKQDTTQTIQTLHDCGINTRMITGDNIFVATQIAFQSGILIQDQPVFIIEGKKKLYQNNKKIYDVLQVRKNNGKILKNERKYQYEDLLKQKISMAVDNDFVSDQDFEMCDQIRVFARILPDNKAKIIQLIKSQFEEEYNHKPFCQRVFGDGKAKVGMVGDGANDLMAIKQADVGVGFNGTDAVFSSAFTINTLQDFIYIVKQGKCTTLNILQCLRFTLIANYINLVVEILTATQATFLSQTQGIYLNFLIIILVPIIISLSYPHQKLQTSKVKDNFLCWQNQILVWLNIIILVGSLVGCYFFITLTNGFIYNPKPVWEIGSGYYPECQLVTVIFLAEGLLLSSLGWIVSQGSPFKQVIFKNIILTIILVLNFGAFTAYFFILDPNGLGFLNLVPMPSRKTGICYAIVMGSIILAFVFSILVHKITYREETSNQVGFKRMNNTNTTQIQLSQIKRTEENELKIQIIQ